MNAIIEAFREQKELRDIILFLSQYGITPPMQSGYIKNMKR